MSTMNLNLARKWRSKNFDQMVGQELSVRILKNSLYLNQLFPVYLFAGQRGCGKTSAARIFAAAVNCAALPDFQKNPKQYSVPCATCDSCRAMTEGNHPDFIEMDAASHTGVDNVRQIIDAASLLPVLGRKKIYLIDEAHMLSKAAFNAFLKILEEPPMGALFILATTDAHKIIDTVRSRCFQLFFKSIERQALLDHLTHICQQEHIKYDLPGLDAIVHESGGSVRDALNLLEQCRFSSSMVSAQVVRRVLGHLDDESIFALLQAIFSGSQKEVLTCFSQIKLESYSAPFVWKRIMEVARLALWAHHGVAQDHALVGHQLFKQLIQRTTKQQVYQLLESLYMNEMVFNKTTAQHALLEMVLLQVCQKNKKTFNSGSAPLPASAVHTASSSEVIDEQDDEESDEEEDDQDPVDEQEGQGADLAWSLFQARVAQLHDPLLGSLFTQARIVAHAPTALTVEFPKDLQFFQEWLVEAQATWRPLLQEVFPRVEQVVPVFTGVSLTIAQEPRRSTVQVSSQPSTQHVTKPAEPVKKTSQHTRPYTRSAGSKKGFVPQGRVIDVSDATLWPKAHMIMQHFPGTIREIQEVQ